MKRLLLFCGGLSGEHEISLISSKHFVQAVSSEKYQTEVVYIAKSGEMFRIKKEQLLSLSDKPDPSQRLEGEALHFCRENGLVGFRCESGFYPVDLAFPLLHGKGGEDGCIQGYLKTLGIPFVGAGVRSSAVAMDKALTKILSERAGVPVVPFQEYRRGDEISQNSFPCFVKPVDTGSSIGATKVTARSELGAACKEAWAWSDRCLIEPAIVGREIEIALLDDGKGRVASCAGEIVIRSGFYSYEAKYVHGDQVELLAPAQLPPEQLSELQGFAWKVFDAVGCSGLARVDFFLVDGGFLLNEINTMPGFTPISMYPKLMQLSGLRYEKLVDRLLSSAHQAY